MLLYETIICQELSWYRNIKNLNSFWYLEPKSIRYQIKASKMGKASSFKKETSNWTDLKPINHLITIKLIKKKTNRQSMTKNALSFITIVVLSLIINLSSTKHILVTANSQSNNPAESQVNKGKFFIQYS